MIYRPLVAAGALLASTALLHAADATPVVYSEPAPIISDYGGDDLVFEFGIGAPFHQSMTGRTITAFHRAPTSAWSI